MVWRILIGQESTQKVKAITPKKLALCRQGAALDLSASQIPFLRYDRPASVGLSPLNSRKSCALSQSPNLPKRLCLPLFPQKLCLLPHLCLPLNLVPLNSRKLCPLCLPKSRKTYSWSDKLFYSALWPTQVCKIILINVSLAAYMRNFSPLSKHIAIDPAFPVTLG